METLDVLTVGYPSSDVIIRVSRAPAVGETAMILDRLDLDTLHPGGCAANIAVGISRLGLRVGIVSAVGDDDASGKYLSLLSNEGVDVSGIVRVTGGNMPRCFLFVTPEGEHQTFYDPGVNAEAPPELPNGIVTTPTRWGVVTVGPKAHSFRMVRFWTQSGISILWSLRRDPRAFPRNMIRYLANVSRIAVMNEVEAEMVQDVLGLVSIRGLLSEESKMEAITITKGSKGSIVMWRGGETHVPAVPPAKFIDPTGAGDAFCAGMLWGARFGLAWDSAARIGTVVASFAIEELGAQTGLPNLAAVRRRYSEFFGEELTTT